MGKRSEKLLEESLRRHYAVQREEADAGAIGALVEAMLAEEASGRRLEGRRPSTLVFVATQVRYIPAYTWAAQLAIVVLMVLVAQLAGNAGTTRLAVGVLSAATVLAGVPTVQASKLHGVAELEYSCPRNAASVLVARLIALGCSAAFAMALMVTVTAASVDVGAFQVVLWACLPFFCSCAGSLALLRHAAPDSATVLCVAWVGMCSAALLAAGHALPSLYAQASTAAWLAAAAVALAWLVREVVHTCRAASVGLDAFAPHMAKTGN